MMVLSCCYMRGKDARSRVVRLEGLAWCWRWLADFDRVSEFPKDVSCTVEERRSEAKE